MRRSLGLPVAVVALVVSALGQPGGGGPRGGGLPGIGAGRMGRGFLSGARFGHRRDYSPWYGSGYGDYSEPYYEEAPPPPMILPPIDEPNAAAPPLMQPKLIELSASVQKTPQQPSLPTTLVWRNGQREEIKQYTISGPFLYDYSKPRALRKIQLDDLDLDATERANQVRGVEFLIPASSSEVTVRF